MSKTKIHYPQWKDRAGSGANRRDLGYRELIEAITLTAELCGQAMSRAAAEMLADDLAGFHEEEVMAALARCRVDLREPLRMQEILLRLDDGRPMPEEAWALVPRNESASVVWTEEMAQAWGAALPLLDAGDMNGAQALFAERYVRLVLDARLRHEPARWMPSLGSDPALREQALRDAVETGRMSAAHAGQLLGGAAGLDGGETALMERADIKSLH